MGTFASLVTFHDDGTMSEDDGQSGLCSGSAQLGSRCLDAGRPRGYRQRMINLVASDTAANLPGTPTFDPTAPITPGFFAGWSIVTHTLRLVDADHVTSAGTNQFYKADGTFYRSGCSTATGPGSSRGRTG